jgi:hypothetical protein
MPEIKKDSNNNVSKQLGSKLDNNLDSDLLNREKEEENSSNLRKAKNISSDDFVKEGGSDNLRKDKKEAERKKNKLEEKLDKVKGKAKQAFKKVSAEFLKFCWKYLIPSWGLTTFLLDIYVILKLTPLSFFLACDPGEEWTLSAGVGASVNNKNLGINKDDEKNVKVGLKIAELMLLLVVNIIIFGVILLIITIIGALVGIAEDPLEFIKAIFGSVWDLIRNLVE